MKNHYLTKAILLVCCSLILVSATNAANRFWVAAAASNWNNTANWSALSGGPGGASVPGAADAAIFNNNGLGNCTVDVAVTLTSINVNATYTGTIIQNANPITTSGAATFAGGIFTGGSANITVTGVFTISGTVFTSTSGILELRNNAAFTGGSFAHNNGTVRYNGTSVAGPTLSGTSPSFYILEFVGLAKTYTISSAGNITVSNALNISGGLFCNLNTGVFDVLGDINITNTATGGGGNAMINIDGAGIQNFNGAAAAGQGALPQLTINNTTGAVNLAGFPSVANNFTYAAATMNAGTSTFCFTRATSGAYTITGSVTLNNILFTANTALTATIAAATTLAVNDLNIAGTANVILNTGGGSATINIVGAANQTIDGTAIIVKQSRLPIIVINKPAGTLTLSGNISFAANVTYMAGTIDPTTSTCNIVNNMTLTGSFAVYNLAIAASVNVTVTVAAGTTITVTNILSLQSGAFNVSINTGTIAVQGDIVNSNTGIAGGGTGTILINGAGVQNITSTGVIDQGRFPAVTINKATGTLVFPSLITVRGNWTYTAGTLDVTTNNSTVVFANSLTITGTHSLNNVTFEGTANRTCTISTGTVLTVTGTLATTGASNMAWNTPVAGATAIQAQGDITINNTGVGGGTAGILINGAGAQAFTSTAAAGQGRMPYITIQKPAGTLTMTGIISETRNWTYTSGTVDATTNSSTVVFGGNNLTITSAGMSFYHATITSNTSTLANNLSVNGNLTINGTGVLAPGANTINLLGNWTDRGTVGFTEATSTVNFNGAVLQTITSPGSENFTNLAINNTGAGIQLINNVTTGTTLTMTQGNIDLNGNIMTLGLSVANRGTLVRTSGTMINTGSFTRWFNTAVIPNLSTTGLFPVGTATNYRLLYVAAPVTAPTTGGTISISYTDATTNSLVSFPDGAFTVVVRKDLNWAMSTANGLAGGTYNLTAEGTGFGTIGNVADLRLTLANSVVGTAGINAGTTTNPQVNRTGLALADLSNTFYIGSVNAINTPLPITLISFTAMAENNIVRLDWETASEINNDHFTVQRSADASAWEDIKVIKGMLNSSADVHYTTNDDMPLSGVSYYRLKQTDVDGKETFSFIRTVNIHNQAQINIYPNPATNYINVVSPGGKKLNIILFNNNGQRINIPVSSSGNMATLNVSGISTGIYYIQINQGNTSEIRKIIIQGP